MHKSHLLVSYKRLKLLVLQKSSLLLAIAENFQVVGNIFHLGMRGLTICPSPWNLIVNKLFVVVQNNSFHSPSRVQERNDLLHNVVCSAYAAAVILKLVGSQWLEDRR